MPTGGLEQPQPPIAVDLPDRTSPGASACPAKRYARKFSPATEAGLADSNEYRPIYPQMEVGQRSHLAAPAPKRQAQVLFVLKRCSATAVASNSTTESFRWRGGRFGAIAHECRDIADTPNTLAASPKTLGLLAYTISEHISRFRRSDLLISIRRELIKDVVLVAVCARAQAECPRLESRLC